MSPRQPTLAFEAVAVHLPTPCAPVPAGALDRGVLVGQVVPMSGYRSPAAPPRLVMPSRKLVSAPAPWTEEHRREALRRTYEIAAEEAASGAPNIASYLADEAGLWTTTELRWRSALRCLQDNARIDREVRRCRALAEGRLVRETIVLWRAKRYSSLYSTKDKEYLDSIRGCADHGWRKVIKRIVRRASR